jgi:hypothetical protein
MNENVSKQINIRALLKKIFIIVIRRRLLRYELEHFLLDAKY